MEKDYNTNIVDLTPEAITDRDSDAKIPVDTQVDTLDNVEEIVSNVLNDETESSTDHITILVDDNDSNLPQEESGGYDKEAIKARRIRQLELRFAGYKPYSEIYPMLSKEFGCPIDIFHYDWAVRDRWLVEAAGLADVNSIMAESKITGEVVQSRFREATKSIYDELNRHTDDEGNIDWTDPVVPLLYGFLRDYLKGTMESTSSQIKNLAKLGIIKEEPKRMQIEEKSVNININAFDVLDENARMKLFGALFEGGQSED